MDFDQISSSEVTVVSNSQPMIIVNVAIPDLKSNTNADTSTVVNPMVLKHFNLMV